MSNWLLPWQEIVRFNKLTLDERSVVFYSEDAASRVHFAPIIEELLKAGQRICYLTSAPSDPILTEQIPGLTSFYIGLGFSRTFLFSALWCKTLVMTMPDLHRYEIRRSLVHPVHYVYVFHTMVSTHMIYREGAFNHYDTILSVGPRHSREIRATEAHYRLPAKILIDHGYGRLDRGLSGDLSTAPHHDGSVAYDDGGDTG
ncbi:MAG: hypothetical protein HYR96_02445 [Deltaproteobacteria bacterium]|nr:hypothetical protein [Deltaproteobacteria bacterium]